MPSLKYVVELSDQDKAELLDIVKKGNSSARTILGANILLASDKRSNKYMTASEIAAAYHTTPTTVQTVRASYYKSLTPMHKNTQGISAYSVYELQKNLQTFMRSGANVGHGGLL